MYYIVTYRYIHIMYVFTVNVNDAAMHSSRKCVNDDEYKTAAALAARGPHRLVK